MLRQLYREVEAQQERFAYTLCAEYLQVYLEKVYDLLSDSDDSPALSIREDKTRGVHAHRATSVVVDNAEAALAVQRRGAGRLRFASTMLNRHSSRSHAVLVLSLTRRPTRVGDVEGCDARDETALAGGRSFDSVMSSEASGMSMRDEGSASGEGVPAVPDSAQLRQQSVYDIQRALERAPETHAAVAAQLTIVDLAGSERVSRTGVSGLKLNEAQKINVSLLALGNVITTLAKRSDAACRAGAGAATSVAAAAAAPHVPFRDSQLTRLLQESLGGNCRTTVLVCASPARSDVDETRSALQFGTRAMRVAASVRRNAVVDLSGLAHELQAKLATAESSLLDAEKRFTLRGASALRRSLRIRAEAADAAANASRDRVLLLEQMASMQTGVEAADAEREQMCAIAHAAAARAVEAEARADAAEAALTELHGRLLSSPSLASAASPSSAWGASLSPVPASPFEAFEQSLAPAGETRYALVKHGLPWRGKYARVLVVSTEGVRTLHPASGAPTNQWGWGEVLDASPVGDQPTMLRLSVCHAISRDSCGVSGRFDSPRASLTSLSSWTSPQNEHTKGDATPRATYLQAQKHEPADPTPRVGITACSPTPHAARASAPFTAPAAIRATRAHGRNSGGDEARMPFWWRLMPKCEMLFEAENASAQIALLNQLRMGLGLVSRAANAASP